MSEGNSGINKELHEKALDAVKDIFHDRTVPGEANVQSLEKLVLEINELIQILQNEEMIP